MSGFEIEPGKPFKLPSGVEIRPTETTPDVVRPETIKAEQDIEDVLEDPFENGGGYQRTLADVSVPAKEFNPVMLILAYSLWGLPAPAIARLLGHEVHVIENVMQSDLFIETRKEILEAIRYAEAGSIHGFLTQKARKAAVVLASKLSNPSADVALSAANSILDRAGFRPADRIEHHHKFDDEMRIVFVDDDKPPAIEVEL